MNNRVKAIGKCNYNSRPEVCNHPEFGMMLRGKNAKYFWTVNEEKKNIINKKRSHYTWVCADDVPRHMIRKQKSRGDDSLRVMCSGCGKMFPKKQMDGALCRGFDGCSVNAEISQIRKASGLSSGVAFR